MKHEFIQVNGIRMHYATEGEGPLLLLLHGFPETWYSWRHQIPALAKQFKVVAPDLRGYGETDKPEKISDYLPEVLANDIAGLIRGLGYEKAHIVGHDWGGGVAWQTALRHPEVVDRLSILNCPHPALFARALRNNFDQMKKSWYVFFFQLPYLPEFLFKLNSHKILKKLFRFSDRPFKEEDAAVYEQSITKPGSFHAALNYYRAALKSPSPHKQISSPTLLIWGEKDIALGKELTYGMEPLFSGSFHIEYIPNCSHWVQEEQPEKVNRLLTEFLKSS